MHYDVFVTRVHVQVVPIQGKGLGVVAKVAMQEGTIAAFYVGTLLNKKGRLSRLAVGSTETRETMDIGDSSFPAAEDGVPSIGPYANEPTWTGVYDLSSEPNCELRASSPADQPTGRLRSYDLVTLREVKAREELTWDYGPNYGYRDYASRYIV